MAAEHRFRRWRRSRPFWGALLVIIGGAEILLTVWAPLGVVLHVGMQGLAGYLVPVVLLLAGILLLFSPGQRLFYSILAVLLAMASWLTSNLGGFLFGMILCLIGAALAFAWTPEKGERTPAKRKSAPAQGMPAPAQGEPVSAQGMPAPAQDEPVSAQGMPAPAQDEPAPARGEARASWAERREAPAPQTDVDGLFGSDTVVPGRHARTEDAPG
jgi:hypothetical protein